MPSQNVIKFPTIPIFALKPSHDSFSHQSLCFCPCKWLTVDSCPVRCTMCCMDRPPAEVPTCNQYDGFLNVPVRLSDLSCRSPRWYVFIILLHHGLYKCLAVHCNDHFFDCLAWSNSFAHCSAKHGAFASAWNASVATSYQHRTSWSWSFSSFTTIPNTAASDWLHNPSMSINMQSIGISYFEVIGTLILVNQWSYLSESAQPCMHLDWQMPHGPPN